MGVMMGAPSWTAHVNSMARSIASHTQPEKTGIIQYDIPNILVVLSNEEWNWLLLQAQVVVISMRCSVCFLFALASFPTEFEGRRQRLWEGTKEEDEEGERGMGALVFTPDDELHTFPSSKFKVPTKSQISTHARRHHLSPRKEPIHPDPVNQPQLVLG